MTALMWAWWGCSGGTEPPVDEQGPLQVGRAELRMPVPVGIGTAGYGGFLMPNATPFSEIYPGTEHLHLHPRFDAIALSRGDGHELVFLRMDSVGVFQQLRRAVVDEVQARTGKDLDDGLYIGATHTHSGPGRVVDGGGLYDLITDAFFPEFYDRMVDAMADVVVAALDDLKPGRVGVGFGYSDDGHDDRRCEDGLDHENGTFPVIALEQEGELVAVMLAYAVHGTVLGIDDLTLSQDVSGGIEQAIEDRFDHPVQVQMFNSWGADMSPSDADLSGPGAALPGGYARIASVGQVMADAVEAAMPDLVWMDAPDLYSRTWRVPIDRTILGYGDGEFPYIYGAVYCSSPEDADCDPATTFDDLDHSCLPFVEEYPAPVQTEFTAGWIGDVQLLTFPGEPGTVLAESITDRIRAEGHERVAFLGYTQDYMGYSILEDDWWNGGYEASGALWGPRQGQYFADQAFLAWKRTRGDVPADPSAPPRIDPFPPHTYDAYQPASPVSFGTVVTDVLPTYVETDVIELVVAGGDPWLGTPTATLVDAAGAPVLRPNGMPVSSDGDPFWWSLTTVPTYAEDLEASTREFDWHLSFPARHPVPGATPALSGTYRVRVDLPDGAGGVTTVESSPFTL